MSHSQQRHLIDQLPGTVSARWQSAASDRGARTVLPERAYWMATLALACLSACGSNGSDDANTTSLANVGVDENTSGAGTTASAGDATPGAGGSTNTSLGSLASSGSSNTATASGDTLATPSNAGTTGAAGTTSSAAVMGMTTNAGAAGTLGMTTASMGAATPGGGGSGGAVASGGSDNSGGDSSMAGGAGGGADVAIGGSAGAAALGGSGGDSNGGATGEATGGSGAEAGMCQTGMTSGSEVLVIGESFIAATHEITREIEKLARANGSLGQNESYRDNAISGTTLAGGGNSIPNQYANGVAEGPVKYVVMDGGGNDCLQANNPDGALSAAQTLFENMQANNTERVLYFFYPDPIGDQYSSLKACLDTLRPQMKAMCDGLTSPQCYWLDLRPTWDGHPEYTSDGIHPTTAGSAASAQAIWEAMAESCVAQ